MLSCSGPIFYCNDVDGKLCGHRHILMRLGKRFVFSYSIGGLDFLSLLKGISISREKFIGNGPFLCSHFCLYTCVSFIGIFVYICQGCLYFKQISFLMALAFIFDFARQDLELGRGKPLFLSRERYAALTNMV